MAGCIYSEAPGYKAKLHRGKVAEVSIAWKDSAERGANARRIVTAVNAHDDLVAALERLHRNFRLMLSARPVRDVAETEAEVLAVLAKAQGHE